MEANRFRPPTRDLTTSSIPSPTRTLSSLSSGISQKPDFRTPDDVAFTLMSPHSSRTGSEARDSNCIDFRTDWSLSGIASPVETILCPICLEPMKTPKILPCLHNTCKKCLNQHIITTLKTEIQEGATPTCFPCPVCQRETAPPDKKRGCEKWASLFPTNFFLHAYSMILAVQKEEVDCDPCQRRGENTLATWWCRECSEYQCNVCKTVHSGFKIFLNHSVISVKEIAKNPDIAVPKYEPCHIHKEKVIQFCREHRTPCCATCIVTVHRKCENVVTVSEEFQSLMCKGSIEDISSAILDYEAVIQELIERRRRITDDLYVRREEIITEIKMVRESFEENLRLLENNLLSEFDKYHAEEISELQKLTTECENLGKQISNAVKLVETVQQSGNEANMINLTEKVSKECKIYKLALHECQAKLQHVDYEFHVDPVIKNVLTTAKSLGSLGIKKSKQATKSISGANPLTSGVIKEVGRIKVWIAGDRGRCGIIGGHYFEDGRILLADFDNFKLKLFSSTGRILSKLTLKCKPSDVAIKDNKTFAVTYPSASGIQFIHLQGNVLSEGEYIHTQRVYQCLAFNNSYLYLVSAAGIAVCYQNGRETNFLSQKEHELLSFSALGFVKASSDCLIITNHENNTVNLISFDGQLLHKYTAKDLNYPCGIDLDNYGNIFVCGKNSSNIHQLDADCQRIKVILSNKDGIENPVTIRFQKFSNKFFISEAKLSNRDYIRLFEWT